VFLRTAVPDVFRWNHDLLLLTPLLALFAAVSLARLAASRGPRPAIAVLALVLLGVQSVVFTARSFAQVLEHAR
jgi:hypothetical protein